MEPIKESPAEAFMSEDQPTLDDFKGESQADRDLENMSEEDIEASIPDLKGMAEADQIDLEIEQLKEKEV